jgi:hypothetical protein
MEISIVRVAGKNCDAIIDPKRSTAVVRFRPDPRIDTSTSDIVSCRGEPAKFRLRPGFHPDAQLVWSITSGEIVSGQGTPEITVLQTKYPAAQVTVSSTYPDVACTSTDTAGTILIEPGEILDFSVSPATIQAGGTAQIHYQIDEMYEWLSISADPAIRGSDFRNSVCSDQFGRNCTFNYKDTHGPGTLRLTLVAGNDCDSESRTIQLTIQ